MSIFTGIAEVKGSFTKFILRVEASGVTFPKLKHKAILVPHLELQISGQAQ